MSGLLESFAVAAGGALGSVGRYWTGVWLAPVSLTFPVATIAINVVGSFVIGLFATLTTMGGRYPVAEGIGLFVTVGICGGFTTFSSFSLQTLDLLRSGKTVRAMGNVVVSVVLGLASVTAGHLLATQLNSIWPG